MLVDLLRQGALLAAAKERSGGHKETRRKKPIGKFRLCFALLVAAKSRAKRKKKDSDYWDTSSKLTGVVKTQNLYEGIYRAQCLFGCAHFVYRDSPHPSL
jgi:hypothetical protein